MKKYVFMFVAAVLAGAFIWSCSQDGMEDQTIYRYNAEQLAEMYGVSDVQYPTESETGLPTIEELEKGFQIVSAIRASLNHPLEVIESDENSIVLRTRKSLAKRTIMDNENYATYTGEEQINESYNIQYGNNDEFHCWLIITVEWKEANSGNQNVKVKFDLEIGDGMEIYVTTKNVSKGWSWHGAKGINIWYSCEFDVTIGSKDYTVKDKIDFHDEITIH